jgi:hypothetical protein
MPEESRESCPEVRLEVPVKRSEAQIPLTFANEIRRGSGVRTVFPSLLTFPAGRGVAEAKGTL